MPSKGTTFYAYVVPRTGEQGVAETWEECRQYVSGEAGARFKRFGTRDAAAAWLEAGADYADMSRNEPGIYFDAGTGRGDGVEVSVTDEKGRNLLWKAVPKQALNRHGKMLLAGDATNNYGELLACSLALKIAQRENIRKIFGDSTLVLDYWSKGLVKKEVGAATIALAREVKALRRQFEQDGGQLEYISGGQNPADLGFH